MCPQIRCRHSPFLQLSLLRYVFKKEPNSGTTTKPLRTPKLFSLYPTRAAHLPPSLPPSSLSLSYFSTSCAAVYAPLGTTEDPSSPSPLAQPAAIVWWGLVTCRCVCLCVCSRSNRSWEEEKQAQVGGRRKAHPAGTHKSRQFVRRAVKVAGGVFVCVCVCSGEGGGGVERS